MERQLTVILCNLDALIHAFELHEETHTGGENLQTPHTE